jgi:hypothetical protein
MEIYEVETLLDVVVATSLAGELVHGARRMVWNELAQVIAWGRLPVDDAEVSAYFCRGRIGRGRAMVTGMGCAGEVTLVAGLFWFSEAEGDFDTVTVWHHGLQEQRRIVRASPW